MNRALRRSAPKPEDLQQLLVDAVDQVLDVDTFNEELDIERADAAELEIMRQRVLLALGRGMQ